MEAEVEQSQEREVMEGVQRRNGLYGFEYRDIDLRRSERPKRFNIKQLWQRSHEIINLAVRGFSNKAIAEILNLNPETVSNTLEGELGQRKLSDLRYARDEDAKKVAEKIRVLTDKSLKVFHEIFDDEQELSIKDKGHFAESFLKEISGLRAPTRIQTEGISVSLTKDELDAFKQRATSAARDSGMIVDVDEEESG